MDEPEEYIDFMVKYKDWISIKRLGIRPYTKAEEIVYYLAGVRTTIDSKAFGLIGIKTAALDAFAASATQGLKKNPASLAAATARFGTPEAKKAIEESCENKELTKLAEIYLINKLVLGAGYDISINQTVMSKIFPDLKPPKTPGRKPKA